MAFLLKMHATADMRRLVQTRARRAAESQPVVPARTVPAEPAVTFAALRLQAPLTNIRQPVAVWPFLPSCSLHCDKPRVSFVQAADGRLLDGMRCKAGTPLPCTARSVALCSCRLLSLPRFHLHSAQAVLQKLLGWQPAGLVGSPLFQGASPRESVLCFSND